MPLEESLQKIKSALVGESEPIRSFGVLLSEAAVQNEALALGLTKTGKDLDEQTKVKARASLITKGLKDAEGDLERTQSSTSNQFRKFTGTIQNLGTSIGAYFLPPITKAVQTLNGWVDVISNMGSTVAPVFDMIGSTISSVFEDMNAAGSGFFSLLGRFPEAWTGAFGPGPVNLLSTIGGAIYSFVGDSLNAVGVVMRNLPDFWDIAVLRITGGIMNIGEYLQAFVANVMQMGNYIANNWSALVMDGVNLVSHAFENLGKNLYMLGQAIVSFLSDPTSGFELNWTPILDGFKATADKLPEMIKPALTSMQDQINEKIGKIGEREAARTIERNKKAVEAATAPAKAETKAAPGVKKEKEFKSESFSAGEFARKLQASITDDKDKTSEKQLMSLEAIEKYTCATAKAATSPKVATLG